ncbi:hypothetical protein GCM10009750_19110 [Agromyces salentinus]|uniref:Uncharacterized protein n=1 Tax=Agromyces salentinus TaxID=269421 RepID=A0ABP4YYP5_9MICO
MVTAITKDENNPTRGSTPGGGRPSFARLGLWMSEGGHVELLSAGSAESANAVMERDGAQRNVGPRAAGLASRASRRP